MSKHTQSIIIFGLVLPAFVILLAIGGVFKIRGYIDAERKKRIAKFESYQQSKTESRLLDKKLEQDDRRAKMAYWNDNLQMELTQGLSKHMNSILEGYNDSQLRRTSMGQPSGRSSLASEVESKYNRFVLGFEGGFGPMQETMAALELKMPRLTLESLKVTPTRNLTDRPYLEFDVTYLAWAPLE